ALGYVAAVPGNPVAFQVELFMSGKGSAYALKRTAASIPTVLPREASYLFRSGRKGPRADQVLAANAVTYAGKQPITASLGGDPSIGVRAIGSEVSRSLKGDRLNPTVSDVALRGPVGGTMANSLLMNASYGIPFADALNVETFRPSPEEIAYHPSAEALSFRYKGESQAEFEERERRCLATAILLRGARRAGTGPDRGGAGHHEPRAQPHVPADDLRRGLSGADASGLSVLLHL